MTTMIETNANQPVDEDWAANVCRYGRGASCCRYLGMGPGGWGCLKLDAQLKGEIDQRAPTMGAKGDNCTGRAKLG